MILAAALLAGLSLEWTPSWGDGTPEGWARMSCQHEEYNGIRWQPFYSEPENRSVTVERRGNVVRVEVWSNEPREIVEAGELECET